MYPPSASESTPPSPGPSRNGSGEEGDKSEGEDEASEDTAIDASHALCELLYRRCETGEDGGEGEKSSEPVMYSRIQSPPPSLSDDDDEEEESEDGGGGDACGDGGYQLVSSQRVCDNNNTFKGVTYPGLHMLWQRTVAAAATPKASTTMSNIRPRSPMGGSAGSSTVLEPWEQQERKKRRSRDSKKQRRRNDPAREM